MTSINVIMVVDIVNDPTCYGRLGANERKEKKDVGKVLSKLSIPSQSTNSSYLRTKIY